MGWVGVNVSGERICASVLLSWIAKMKTGCVKPSNGGINGLKGDESRSGYMPIDCLARLCFLKKEKEKKSFGLSPPIAGLG